MVINVIDLKKNDTSRLMVQANKMFIIEHRTPRVQGSRQRKDWQDQCLTQNWQNLIFLVAFCLSWSCLSKTLGGAPVQCTYLSTYVIQNFYVRTGCQYFLFTLVYAGAEYPSFNSEYCGSSPPIALRLVTSKAKGVPNHIECLVA